MNGKSSRDGALTTGGESVPDSPASEARPPLFERVLHGLQQLIELGALPTGLVLLEGPIAAYFGVSRMPVRRALSDLAKSRIIRKFRGRGYLVDPDGHNPPPLRVSLQSLDLPSYIANVRDDDGRRYVWQRVHNDIASEIARCLLFGTYRIREAGICETYGASRTVVREVLGRLMAQGLIEKDSCSHWICGPFTARANSEQYAMRRILEPQALREALATGQVADIGKMLDRLESAQSERTALSEHKIRSLERDLHGTLLDACTNTRLKATIRQNQLSLSINETFYTHFGVASHEPMLEEHRRVLTALMAGRVSEASKALAGHLDAARARSQARLKVLAVIDLPDLPQFLERIH